MTSFGLFLLCAVVFEALLVGVERSHLSCMMLGRIALAAGVGLPGLSNASHIDDRFINIPFSISAALGSFQVQKQKYWNPLSEVM